MSLSVDPNATPVPNLPPRLDVHEGVATITLSRPRYRNRLHDEDLAALLDHFTWVQSHPEVHVLVLTADTEGQATPVFCAGYHVAGFDEVPPEQRVPFERVPDALEALPLITVCALNGGVFGGATDLALACDFRLGREGMVMRMPAAALGLHYYPSGMQRYLTRLGLNVAKKAFLTAHTFSDQELLKVGYLDQLYPSHHFEHDVHAFVAQLSQLAPLAQRGMKASLNELARGDQDLSRLRAREAESVNSADFAEGREAFAQRRPPKFTGR